MNQPLVHVLIINWNGMEHLPECFDTLLESTYGNVEFVLLDNGSTDGSVEFVESTYGHDKRVEVLHWESNLGWGGGNNVGLRRALESDAKYVFVLNNDTAVAPDAIEKLVAMAEERPEIGALAPKMLLYSNPTLINSLGITCSIIGCGWDVGIGRLDGERWNAPRQVAGFCGGAALLRVDALRKTGLLPEEFGIYSDDLDLSFRVWNAGYEIWSCPEAVVRHKFSATMGEVKRVREKYFLNTRNRFWLLARNFPLAKIPLVKAAALLGECKALGRAVLDGEFWRVQAHARAWLASVGYMGTALSERWRRRRNGMGPCRFWHLVVPRPLFAPALHLPEDGWYPEQLYRGWRVRPMSSIAHAHVAAGRVRILHVNRCARAGLTDIEVRQGSQVLAALSTHDADETVLEVAEGMLEFRARKIFNAEETDVTFDIGGWIQMEQC